LEQESISGNHKKERKGYGQKIWTKQRARLLFLFDPGFGFYRLQFTTITASGSPTIFRGAGAGNHTASFGCPTCGSSDSPGPACTFCSGTSTGSSDPGATSRN